MHEKQCLLSQPFFMVEVFIGSAGEYLDLAKAISGLSTDPFRRISMTCGVGFLFGG